MQEKLRHFAAVFLYFFSYFQTFFEKFQKNTKFY